MGRDEVPCRPGTDGVSAPTFKGTGHNLLFFFCLFALRENLFCFPFFLPVSSLLLFGQFSDLKVKRWNE